ncbi:MAG: hypothetical protein IJQ23_04780 [Clostridia bacterium]|nr:hypothetical protein [Clostridia bacterium]
MFISATHTHTGPCLKDSGNFDYDAEVVKEYLDFLAEQSAKAAKTAIKDLKPAKMGYATGKAPDRIAYIRRYKMKDGSTMTCPPINDPNIDYPLGTLDQRVNVLRFDRENAESIVIMNYGIHADTVNGEMISSDWVGWAQSTLAKSLDGVKCVCIMGAQGDVGSTNVHPTDSDMNDTEISFDNEMKSPGMARFVGRALAGTVLQVYDKVQYVDVDSIKIITEPCKVDINVPDKKDLPLAHKYAELHEQGRDDLIPFKAMELTTVVAEAMRMVRLENSPKTKTMEMKGLRLGNIALVGIPGEPFTEIGEKIKAIGGFDLIMPCALTNGYEGYFPSKAAYLEGGYEARTSEFKDTVSEIVVNTISLILKKLK